jgi:cyclophilin family peptidyl-prolyl cis-trans isomerase
VTKQYRTAPDLEIDLDTEYTATLHTTLGDITIGFLPAEAPLAVNNFLFLAREGFYDGVIFHRVIEGFVIQAGDPTGTGRGGPGYQFRDELDGTGKYTRGTVAMANAGPNTNGSQFFITLVPTPWLDGKHTVFGRVVKGLDVLKKIGAVQTDAGDRPVDSVRIQRVTLYRDAEKVEGVQPKPTVL